MPLLTIDAGRPFEIQVNASMLPIQPLTWRLLWLLAQTPSVMVPYNAIHWHLWECRGVIVEDNQMHFQARKLRKMGLPIQTVPKNGLMLNLPASAIHLIQSPWANSKIAS